MPKTIRRYRPKTREEWLALRQPDITASTVSVLFGANPYQTVADLWAEKTGRTKRDIAETPAMRRGRLLEAPAVQILREERPAWKIRYSAADLNYYREGAARLGATPDVLVEAPGRGAGIVQIKSVDRGVFRRDWHAEDGSIDVPLQHALQATLEAHLTGSTWAAVGALLFGYGGLDLELIEVPLLPGVVEAMRAKAGEFWGLVESGKEPPLDFANDGELIRRLYPGQPGDDPIDLSTDNRVAELVALHAQYSAQKRSAEADLATIKNELAAKLGNHTVGLLAEGKRLTYRLESRKAYSVEASETRVLRFPQGRRITAETGEKADG